jgi:putative FmdB family regulatory protein
MPIYSVKCNSCGKEFESFSHVEKRNDIQCKCGGSITIQIFRQNVQVPLEFSPYWSENMSREPIYITSRSHRKQLLKEKKLDIIPYKKFDRPKVVRDRRGHIMTDHEISKAQTLGMFNRPGQTSYI